MEQNTAEMRRRELYENQKKLLETFLEHGAISRAQYEKSLGDLTEKMGYAEKTGDRTCIPGKTVL